VNIYIDKSWKEVFLLVAGSMGGGADELVCWMDKEVQKYINTPRLRNLLRWADAEANVIAIANANAVAEGNVITIAEANAITKNHTKAIFLAHSHAYIYAKAIDQFLKLATKLEEIKIFAAVNFTVLITRLTELKDKIPDDKQPQKVGQAFVDRLLQTWLNGFNLTQEMVNLSNEELKALDNYFYANYLIIQCKEAAVRVSTKTWEAIEERMLLIPDN
jgi:hypothetical protein